MTNTMIDKIYEAVEEAVMQGIRPEEFVKEVRTSWSEALGRRTRMDMEEFNRMLK